MKKDLHVTPVEIKRQRKLTYYPWCHSNRDFPEDMSLCLSVFLTNDKLQILSTQWEKYFWFVKFIFVVKFSGKFSSVHKRNLSRQVYVCNACHRSNIATLSSVSNYQVHDQLKTKILLLTNVGFELYFNNFFSISNEFHINSFSNIFYSFTKDTIIHKFEEIFLKWIFGGCSFLRVEIDVLF